MVWVEVKDKVRVEKRVKVRQSWDRDQSKGQKSQ